MRILFDVTRLGARIGRCTPSGIDRVDFAYLHGLARLPGCELRLVSFDRLGPRLWSPADAAALRARADAAWSPPVSPASPGYLVLQRWLDGMASADGPAPRIAEPVAAPPWQTVAWWRRALRRPAESRALRILVAASIAEDPAAAPRTGSVYVNTSHGSLFRPAAARWFARSPSVARVFFVHDLIPLRYPEYNRPQEPARHAARLATIRAHAGAVIVNSRATRDDLLAWWGEAGPLPPPVYVAPLGIDDRFARPPSPGAVTSAQPYFVAVGTIEPRKNHRLLLDLWDHLVAQRGDAAPRLVLVGRRGWRNQAVFARLDGAGAARTHVAECAGLSDDDVVRILAGARALLMPSYAEGYGLPVAEALAVGTPVIASDLPALREVAGEAARLLDPWDPGAWLAAILDHLDGEGRLHAEWRRAASAYRAPRWAAHFETFGTILAAIGPPAATSRSPASRKIVLDPRAARPGSRVPPT